MEKGKYSALQVAAYVIEYLNSKKSVVSNLKLQKLLYYIQGMYTVPDSDRFFKEEMQAWDFGPVVAEVYKKYRIFGSGSIPSLKEMNEVSKSFTKSDLEFIDSILDIFKPYTASDLVNMTHQESPWKDAFAQGRNQIIPFSSLSRFFNENYS